MSEDINKRVAEKMGWVLRDGNIGWYWKYPGMPEMTIGNVIYRNELPSFSTDWNATKIVIKFMRERDWLYDIGDFDGAFSFWWFDQINGYGHVNKEIIDDDLPLAACELFLLIDLEVNDAKTNDRRNDEGSDGESFQ